MEVFKKNTKKTLWLQVPNTEVRIPAVVFCGRELGQTITISAGIHSREYVGIQALQDFASDFDPSILRGRILLLPAVNYNGVILRSPDTVPEDGKNLNRIFPGDPQGTVSQRMADFLVREILPQTDYLIDLHSGGFCEDLFPHAYLNRAAAGKTLAQFTNISYAYHSQSTTGFSGFAGTLGIPGMILERGGRGLWAQGEVQLVKADILNLLRGLGFLTDQPPVLYEPRIGDEAVFLNSPASGLWYPRKKAGQLVRDQECLGEIRSVHGEILHSIQAQFDGVVLYQTISLGIEAGTPMIAYQKTSLK